MLISETLVRIRRAHADGKSIKAIARDLRLSRKVVRKAIRAPELALLTSGRCNHFPGSVPSKSGWTRCWWRTSRGPAGAVADDADSPLSAHVGHHSPPTENP